MEQQTILKHGMLVSINNITYLVIELTETNISCYINNPSDIELGFYGLSGVRSSNDGDIYNLSNYGTIFSLKTKHIQVDNIKVLQECFDGNIKDIK